MQAVITDRAKRLGEGSIPRLLLLDFSLPAIVGMLAQALYNIIDRIFVGQAMDADAIAGITVSFPFMLVVLSLCMLIGFGATALISIRLGQQKREEAERVLGNALVLLLIAALLVTVAGARLAGAPLAILRGPAKPCSPTPATTCKSSCWAPGFRC